jgi:AraC-like DNA-binding protein
MVRVVDYLCDHLANQPSLDDLARIAGSNRLTLSRNFKRLYGMTVFEWLREQRLGHAAKLLGESNRPISEIATTVGYSSLQGLANAFKQRFELSPSSYRNATRSNSHRK